MTAATITKEFRFEAAHRLPNHKGKCSQPHGHSYRLEVMITGEVKPNDGESDEGMVVDFGVVSAIWKEHLEPYLDHQDLNDTVGGVTTAENLACHILAAFRQHLPVAAVRLWETSTSSATVFA